MASRMATSLRDMKKDQPFRILVAAGGTGGHVYPALAIAEALVRLYPQVTLGFVGGVGGFERPLMKESTVQFASYDEVRSGPLHGVNILKMIASVFQLIIGTVQALWLVKRRKPDALLLTGGWVGLPVALAAWVWRVPSMIFLPDIEPGLTIKVLRRLVKRVALTVDESKVYFPSNETVVTGYPLRQAMLEATREAAVKQFDLDPTRKTLLVFGGSRGSRAINYCAAGYTAAVVSRWGAGDPCDGDVGLAGTFGALLANVRHNPLPCLSVFTS